MASGVCPCSPWQCTDVWLWPPHWACPARTRSCSASSRGNGCTAQQRIIELWNCSGWKTPLRSLSPTITPAKDCSAQGARFGWRQESIEIPHQEERPWTMRVILVFLINLYIKVTSLGIGFWGSLLTPRHWQCPLLRFSTINRPAALETCFLKNVASFSLRRKCFIISGMWVIVCVFLRTQQKCSFESLWPLLPFVGRHNEGDSQA